jgi:hypothetical protein
MTCDTRLLDPGMPAVECCRWNHLVYVRTLKCASEFFYRNFVQTARWKPMSFASINWEQDTVFSYIMDPIKRRHKGICEFIISIQAQQQLFDDQKLRLLISKISCLDEHSASLTCLYGDKVSDINWLLIDDDHSIAIDQTNSFLQTHGHPVIEWDMKFQHRTDNYMEDMCNTVKNLWDDKTVPFHVKTYFESDIDLYLKIKSQNG